MLFHCVVSLCCVGVSLAYLYVVATGYFYVHSHLEAKSPKTALFTEAYTMGSSDTVAVIPEVLMP